jgi:hypothetical protein
VEETLRALVAAGLGLLLVMLRLDAERFGVAEYLDGAVGGRFAVLRRRLASYAVGLTIIAAIVVVHPDAAALGLSAGDRGFLLAGLGYAALGVAQAAGMAYAREGRLRPPAIGAYPWGIGNAVATAFIDEATFRGILLGFILATGLDAPIAIVVQALVYAIASRTGAPGRDPYRLVLSLAVGLIGGWLTVETGGIGAAFLGHAVARSAGFAVSEGDEARTRLAAGSGAAAGPAREREA